MRKFFTVKEEAWLRSNYPKLGAIPCAKFLNRSVFYTQKKAAALGVRVANPVAFRKAIIAAGMEERLDSVAFLRLDSPLVAYCLGFIWADGHVSKRGSRISLCIQKRDFRYVWSVFSKTGDWNKHQMKKRKQWVIYISHAALHSGLVKLGFRDKSVNSPTLLLEKLPSELHSIFWLGFFDGDGCVYRSRKRRNSFCVSVTGSYHQDWTDFLLLLSSIGITPHFLRRREVRKGRVMRSSVIYFYRWEFVSFLFVYFYPLGNVFGLPRKYLAFRNLLSSRV